MRKEEQYSRAGVEVKSARPRAVILQEAFAVMHIYAPENAEDEEMRK